MTAEALLVILVPLLLATTLLSVGVFAGISSLPRQVRLNVMNFSKLLRSFVIGSVGLAHAFRTEQNMRIHCLIALGVIVAGLVFRVAAWEWIALWLCIGLVISAECLNTAIERLADRVSRETDPFIKQAKDCGSAAVLVLAITAAVVGGVVFVPKLWAGTGW